MADKGPVSHLRELRDRNDEKGYDEPLWQAMVEAGLTGILVPEEHGGIGFGLVGAGLVAREIGRNLSVTPFLSTAVLGATALATGGSAEQQQKWLPAIAEGSVITALAVDDGAKHRPEAIKTEAQQAGDGVTLNGGKLLVLDAHVADLLLVAARQGDNTALFLVDPKAQGVTIERTRLVDDRNAARVTLDNVAAEPMADGCLAAALRAPRKAGRETVRPGPEAFERTCVPQGAQAVRPPDRHLPGAAAPRRAADGRSVHERRPGDAGAGRLRPQRRRRRGSGAGRQGQGRPGGAAGRPGSGADARRHRHDR